MLKNGEKQKDRNVDKEQKKIQQEIIRVLKKHVGKTKSVKLNMKLLFFQVIKGIKTLKVKGIGYNVGGH
jgi:hypothetical protein